MKRLFRLIQGGKPPRMKFASFGRERDVAMINEYVTDPILKQRYLEQTEAAHDLNDGIGSIQAFIEASRNAILPSSHSARNDPLILLARIGAYYPQCHDIWDELAISSGWVDRFTVACRLYQWIPEPMSDRLFNSLRHDNSKRVREIAIQSYELRPNSEGRLLKMYDANFFDDRVKSGDVKF